MSMSKKVGMYRQSSRRLDTMSTLHSNQEILQDFLGTTCRLVSEGTSDTYVAMVMTKFNRANIKKFPFVKYIHLYANGVKVDKKVNSNDPAFVGKFIKRLIDSLFSDLFKHLITRKLDVGILGDLKSVGVRL